MLTGVSGAWGQTVLLEYGTGDVPWTAEGLATWTAGGTPTFDNATNPTYVGISGGNGSYSTSKNIAPTAGAILRISAVWRGCSNTGRTFDQGNGSYFRFGKIIVAQNDQDPKHGYGFSGLENIASVTPFTAGSYRTDIANCTWLKIDAEINTATNTLTSFTIKSEDEATTYVTLSNVALSDADYTTVAFGYYKTGSVSTNNAEQLKSIKITSTPAFTWTASDATINITDVGSTNPNVVASLPVLTINNSDASPTYTSSNTNVATFNGSSLYIKNTGSAIITASYSTYSTQYSLTVNGTAATTSSTTFSTTQKYDEWKLTSTGTLPTPTTVGLDYITMSVGYTGENLVSVGSNLLKVIDANGFSHVNRTSDVLHEDAWGGTFYKFVTTVPGTLTITGTMASPVLLNGLSTSAVVAGTTSTSTTFTAANLPAGTYYFYNSSFTTDGSATTTAPLSSFRFTLPEQTLSDFPSASYAQRPFVPGMTVTTQTITNSSVGGSSIVYTSSDPSVASVNATTGAVTILKGGHTVITATAAAIPGTYGETSKSYPIDVNVADKWVFDNAYFANNLASSKADLTNAGLTLTEDNAGRWQFVSGTYVQLGVDCQIEIPDLQKEQVVEVITHAGHSNHINFTNALDVSTHEDKTSEAVNTGLKTIRLIVKDNGSFTMKGQSSNDTYIHAIYVYTPNPTTGTMEYNQGLNMQAGGGSAFVTSVSDSFRDTPNSRDISGSIFGEPCKFRSSDTDKLTVNASTGVATAVAAGDVSITAKAYPSADYATTYAVATVTASVTVESRIDKNSKMIKVGDLLYTGKASSADNGLDRTIPSLLLTMTGGDKVMSSLDGNSLDINGGTIRIAPRYQTGHSKNVYIPNAVAFFADGSSRKYTASSQQYIDITATLQEITHIYVEYTSSDYNAGGAAGTSVADLLVNTAVTPYLKYEYATYQVEKDYTIDYILPTVKVDNSSGAVIKNLEGLDYSLTDNGHVTKVDGQLRANSVGNETLTATFDHGESPYFVNPASSENCTINVVAKTDKSPSVAFSEKLTGIVESLPDGKTMEEVLYPTMGIDGFVFADELHTPTPALTGADLSNYKVTYSSSDNSIAYPSSDGSKIYTANKQGLATITATFTPVAPNDPSTSPLLTAVYKLYVLSGKWNFAGIDNNTTDDMQLSPWSKSGSSNGSNRDTEDFQPILKDDHNPLGDAVALQTAYSVRMFNSGAIHLNGQSRTAYSGSNGGVGGVLRIPVRDGMTVEITAYNATGEGAEISLDGLNQIGTSTPATVFAVAYNTPTSYLFTANRDGYVDIINSTANVNLFIKSINVTNDLQFEYGNETFVRAGSGRFKNPIISTVASSLSYDVTNVKSDQATGIDEDGEVTFGAGKGQYRVNVTTAVGATSSYIVNLIDFGHTDYNATITSEGTVTFDLRNQISTLSVGGVFGDESGAKENEFKNKIVFSIIKGAEMATLSDRMLTIDGAGIVKVKAKLGAISEDIVCTISGAALGYYDSATDADVPNATPVIANDATTYTIKIIGAGASTPKFKVKKMYDAIMGDLRASRTNLKFYTSDDNSSLIASPSTTEEVASATLRIEGYDRKGGVIPIYASYSYSGNPYNLEGTLTVAYTSHVWNFMHNLIKGDQSSGTWPYHKAEGQVLGVDAGINTGLGKWYAAYTDESTNTREGKWTTTATFDMPTDDDDADFAKDVAQSHVDTHDWRFVRKMKSVHPESSMIYYYNHNIQGQNALVIPETQGLVFHSTKSGQQFGVEMSSLRVKRASNSTRSYPNRWGMAQAYNADGTEYVEYPILDEDGNVTNPGDAGRFIFDKDGNPSHTDQYLDKDRDKVYNCSNLMLLNGGSFTIPNLKQGQWVEIRWTRHQDDLGERIRMTNLSDVEGKPITETYKIGNCFYNLPWSTSTYMFQATEDGDVTFEVTDNVYVSIQQIELHPVGYKPEQIVSQLNGYDDTAKDGSDKKYADYTIADRAAAGWTAFQNAPKVKWQYIWDDDEENHVVTFLSKQYQNAPNAPQTWTFEMDEMLTREGAKMTYTDAMDSEATLTYKGGWGKVTITMTSYSQNMKYVANKKSWTITFGQAPKQTYPYTWDFTKYFKKTKTDIGSDTWITSGDTKTADYTNYDTQNYTTSYYVEGAQLVSYALRNNGYNGVLPETQGLGFKMDTSAPADATPDATLSIKMTDVVNNAAGAEKVGDKYQTWKTTDSYLSIGAGGKLIVPKPGDGYAGYYVYINSDTPPSAYTQVRKMVNTTPVDGTEEKDDDYDIRPGQYKYHFTANANAEFTFGSDAKVYAVGVTNMFKPMTNIGGTAWATEARGRAIDYTLDSLLTINPVRAYAVIASISSSSTNPRFAEDKSKTTVDIKDQRYVVPRQTGLVLKQVQRYNAESVEDDKYEPLADASDYRVPLFVPAVTTAEDATTSFRNNLMRCAADPDAECLLNAETETISTSDGFDLYLLADYGTDFTRYILAKRFMTWSKAGDQLTTPTAFESKEAAAFYRLHYYGSSTGLKDEKGDGLESADALNTLGANKAYLILPTSKIPAPLWPTSPESPQPAPGYYYAGILGVSDWAEEAGRHDETAPRTYNLKGQLVDGDAALPKGVYIRNGRKVIVK